MTKVWRANPQYIVSRIKNYFYFKNNQNLPWLVKDANEFLIENLRNDMSVLEFGSGRSTQFFAKRVNKVFSREHNEKWYNIVLGQLKSFSNVQYDYFDDLGDYANVDGIENNSLDMVLVDGRNRVNCLLNSIQKLKIGGVLVLDNAERYLVYPTSSPAKYVRSERNEKWSEAEEKLKNNFFRIKTTDGVSDTLFFFKRK